MHYLGLLKSVLGYVDTKDYTYGQLFNEINARTGGIQCGVDVFDKANDPEVFRTMFTIRGKALYSQMDFLFQMMGEILNTSRLTDIKRLREIIGELKLQRTGFPDRRRPSDCCAPRQLLRISYGEIPGRDGWSGLLQICGGSG